MDRSEFYKNLKDIHLQETDKKTSAVLSEKQMQELQDNVYAHIETLFPDDAEPKPKPDVIGKITSSVKPANDNRYVLQSVFAASLAFLMIGGFALFKTIDNNSLGLPASSSLAGLTEQVSFPLGASRAIADPILSQRRHAYLAGYTKANLYVLGKNDDTAEKFALWYLQNADQDAPADAQKAVSSVNGIADDFLAEEYSSFWYKQGLATELVNLAAKDALVDLDTSILDELLDFYKKVSDSITSYTNSSNDLAYLAKHQELVNSSELISTPDELQRIIDSTRAMKILIQ